MASENLPIRYWGTDGAIIISSGAILGRIVEWDIAVIKSSGDKNSFVEIAPNIRHPDPVVGVGFPSRSGREEFDVFSAVFEGETLYRDTGGLAGLEGKIKGGQIEPGFSGGPLLNMRTLAVAGMVAATRDRRTDLGGWIIPAEYIYKALDRFNIQLNSESPIWRRAVDEQTRLEVQNSRRIPGVDAGTYIQHAPPLPAYYVKRATDLEGIVGRLVSKNPTDQALAISAVHGLGGVGKTSMAIAAARSDEIRASFPDGVLWTSLGQSPQLLQTMTYWLRSLGEILDIPLSLESGTIFLRTKLQLRSMLIVIDDAWDEADVAPLLVGGQNCRVLITTRRAHVADRVGAETWTLSSMTQSESLELLAKRSRMDPRRSITELEDARLLVRELGHLPLALELSGALAGRGYSWSEIREQLLAVEIDEDAHATLSPSHMAIDRCLSLSITLLKERDVNAWEIFIRLGSLKSGANFDADIASHFLNRPRGIVSITLAVLQDDALLQKIGNSYSLHALLGEAAKKRITRARPDGLGLTLIEAHKTVVGNYRQTCGGLLAAIPDDGYIHDHLAWHLAQANDYASLRAILTAEDDRGRNVWFESRDRKGQMAGYREDVGIMLDMAISQGTCTAPDQLLCALSLSSTSGARRLSPSVLKILIKKKVWTAARGYSWVLQEKNDDKQLALLVALAESISQILLKEQKDESNLDKIYSATIERAKTKLLSRKALSRRAILAANILELLPSDEQGAALSEISSWCDNPSDQVSFLAALPEARRYAVVTTVISNIKALDSGIRKLELFAQCLPFVRLSLLCSVVQETFDTISHCVGLARPIPSGDKQSSKVEESLFAARDMDRQNKGSTSFLEEIFAHSASQAALARSTSNDIAVILDDDDEDNSIKYDISALESGHPDGFKEIMRRIFFLLNNYVPTEFRKELQEHLNSLYKIGLFDAKPELRNNWEPESKSHEFYPSDTFAGYETLFDKALTKLSHIYNEQEIIGLSNSTSAFELIQSFYVALENGELEGNRQDIFMEHLYKRFKFTELHLYELRKTPAVFKNFASEIMRSKTSENDRDAAIIIGLSVVKDESIVLSLVDDYFRHCDIDLQLSAVYKLMPYLPTDYPEILLEPYTDSDIVGVQNAGLTRMMRDLIVAIGAGELSAVVEAASSRHSEWWVVEALSMTLINIIELKEFEAIFIAATHIKNGDLRARIIGRLARRAADIGYLRFSATSVECIDSDTLRDDEMCELASRIASGGNLTDCDSIASQIGSKEARSRAYFNIALEMGALGRGGEALWALERIPISGVRQHGLRMLGPEDGNKGVTVSLQGRLAMRKECGEGASVCDLVISAINAIENIMGERNWMNVIKTEARGGRSSDVMRVSDLPWATSNADHLHFAQELGNQPRDEALILVGHAAPIIGLASGGSNVIHAIEAIKNVSRWWP